MESSMEYPAPASERLEAVLSDMFLDIHHAPKIHKFYVGSEFEHWEINYGGDLSTWDFSALTRLVASAHKNCVGVSMLSSGPSLVKIRLYPRFKREGSITERHPTMEEHLILLERKYSYGIRS